MLAGAVLGSTAAGALLVLFHHSPLIGVPLAILAYFAVLLGSERLAFPEDFSVAHALVSQLRSRLGRPATSGGVLCSSTTRQLWI